MNAIAYKWIKITILSLLMVSFLGLIMRYKICFEFSLLDQKKIQHSHSHFAFAGWVSQALMFLLVYVLNKKIVQKNIFKKYSVLLWLNLFLAYAMLISFIIYGYNLISIFFSTSSLIVSYAFSYQYFKDIKENNLTELVIKWFKASLIFNVISSFGTYYLAYMMITKNFNQDLYLASVYYYLHFQYNGWFLMACLGLFYYFFKIEESKITIWFQKITIWVCIPTYILSLLWFEIPIFIYIITVASILVQTTFWFLFYFKTKNKIFIENLLLRNIFSFITFSLSLKFILQLLSVIPALSKFAFGSRAVIIAYLHLVLLAIISLFLLFVFFNFFKIKYNKRALTSFKFFCIGVFFNEFVLALQGLASVKYISIPFVNEILLFIAIVLFISITLMIVFFNKKNTIYDSAHKIESYN